ncbi:MAG: 30S ribosomal protein S6, partial [Phycisphaerae bacterium]|nr:30S ribosomal protein S6 [Phycisphaerae bacterium]
MSENKTYEGMFLVDSGKDFQAASEPINTVLERSETEVLSLRPWEERRLAYPIRGQKRGLYVLAYFKADPERIGQLERDCQLNEDILRVLILRRDRITDEEIHTETPTTGTRSKPPTGPRDAHEKDAPADTEATEAKTTVEAETIAEAETTAEAAAS